MSTSAAAHLVRPGATRVEVENSGDLVFLYDLGEREALRAALPAWAAGEAAYDPADPAFQRLAAEGRLVAYEAAAPSRLRAQVVVGAPLTTAEHGGARWLRPAVARLRLPSGRLCVEPLDALRLLDEPPSEPGAVLDMPPGEYVLTLHRIDRAAMNPGGPERDQAAAGPPGAAAWPDEVLALTPAADAEAPAESPALLRWPLARPRWGAWRVEGDTAHGEVTWALVGAGTNLDAGAVARLGLRPGMRLEARLGPQCFEAVYLGALDQQAYRELVGAAELDAAAARERALARAWLYPNPGPAGETLPALAFNDFTGEKRDWSALAIGMPASVRALPDPVFATPEDGWASMWRLEDGALHVEVVGCGEADLVLGATAEGLAALGAVPGETLALEVGGATREVLLVADQRAAAGAGAPAGVLVAWPMPHWELGDRRVLRLRPLGEPKTGVSVPLGAPAVLRRAGQVTARDGA